MSARSLPRVTVITPAYNRAGYLDEVIGSVLGQGYPDLEHIVLDDGSTDGTPEVLRRHEGRIVAVSHPNMGETRTVNRGFSMARGDIIGVVNSDDPLLPGAVRRIVDRLEADRRLVAVYPDFDTIDAQGRLIETVRPPDYRYLDMLRWHRCLPGPGTFFRREAAERLGGRDPGFRYVADFDFWLRAGLLGPFARLPEVLATFRVHETSASVRERGRAMAAEHLRLVEKIFSLSGLDPAVRAVRREAFSSACYVAGCVALHDDPAEARRLFRRALAYAPGKYLGEYGKRLPAMLDVLAPGLLSAARGLKRAFVPRRDAGGGPGR